MVRSLFLETTGVVPVSIGKPAPYLLEAAAHVVGREPSEAIMIGDGIGTDLAAARAVGARCVLMLTGVTTQTQVEAIPADSAAQISLQVDPMANVIAIDEAQFLDDGIVPLVTSLAARGRRVIVAGTDTDFRGDNKPCRAIFDCTSFDRICCITRNASRG